jgi:RNase H-like domain found in reverse transcriptase
VIPVLERPQTVKQLRSFIGALFFYCDMFQKGSHILAPLTTLVGGKGPLKWTDEYQTHLRKMKAAMAHNAVLRHHEHNKPFHIHCDASDLQLRAVITQTGAPEAFSSHQLTQAQTHYTVGDK